MIDSSRPPSCDGTRCGLAAFDVNRRTFIAKSVVSLAAIALAGCMPAPTGPSVSGSVNLSDYPALANVDGVALVNISGYPVAIVRESDSSFAAFSRICPHMGGLIYATGNGFACPVHGAQFGLDGSWQGGQRTSGLQSYKVAYDSAAGTITVS